MVSWAWPLWGRGSIVSNAGAENTAGGADSTGGGLGVNEFDAAQSNVAVDNEGRDGGRVPERCWLLRYDRL
jgi:hypothetical protein